MGALNKKRKRTCKSALSRALANFLAPIKVVADCPRLIMIQMTYLTRVQCVEKKVKGREKLPVTYKKMKIITLSLSAPIDAVVGTLAIEKVLREG